MKANDLMKKALPLVLLTLMSTSALAAQVVTVSRFEMGKNRWPLNREEIMLSCEKDGSLFAINPSTLMNYPLNPLAEQKVKSGQALGESITPLLLDDPAHPGEKMSLQPLTDKAQSLCGKSAVNG